MGLTWIYTPKLWVSSRRFQKSMFCLVATSHIDESPLEEHQLIVDHPDRHRVSEI